MAYIINRYTGSQLTAVEDGTIDQTTDIKFVGKNFSGYGEAQNENFLFLLENFSGTTPPTKALDGQVWYDSGTQKLKFYTGTQWKNAGGAEVSPTQPAGLNEGDLWWSTTSNQLYGRTGAGEFLLIGPQAAGQGETQMLSIDVLATGNVLKSVIIALINSNPVYIISNEEFTPLSDENQPAVLQDYSIQTNFPIIKKGITLSNVNSEGVTVQDGTADTESVYWGTASDSLLLGGRPASDYALTAQLNFLDTGFTVGDSGGVFTNKLKVDIVTASNNARIFNNRGVELQFGASSDSVSAVHVASVINTGSTVGIIPGIDNGSTTAATLGSTARPWQNVYANTFTGNATNALQLDSKSSSTISTPNTIAARDINGNLTANVFNGTATKARYADLAEKYTTDKDYPVGTIVKICDHEDHEACVCGLNDFAIGVISEKPAYLMNSDAEGQAIALVGRVPVRIIGEVKKGQKIYTWNDGLASTIKTDCLVGIALETNKNDNEKLVECILKV